MKNIKRTVGGIEFDAICYPDKTVSLSAEMTETQHAERSEVWALLAEHGWRVEVTTHADDADIVDAGNVWVLLQNAA